VIPGLSGEPEGGTRVPSVPQAAARRVGRFRVYTEGAVPTSPLFLPALVITALLAACFSEHTAPSTGGEGVTVGNILFRSNHNGTANPAVDTVAPGTTVMWTWVNTGSISHSVESEDSPSFQSSSIMGGSGTTYTVTFTTPGTYQYDCAVHGSAMTGTIVVR